MLGSAQRSAVEFVHLGSHADGVVYRTEVAAEPQHYKVVLWNSWSMYREKGGLFSLLLLLHGYNVVYRNLLLSHGITRLATQGWLFIAPLVLVRFTPGRLIGPAVWGLVTMLGSALLAPPLGAWADQTDRRWVVTLGVSAQAVAVLGSTLVLFLALQGADARVADGSAAPVALAAFTCFSVLEKLGTALSDVAVKREWAPRLFQGDRLKRRSGGDGRATETRVGGKVVGRKVERWLGAKRVCGGCGYSKGWCEECST
ncbi:unnamed protein product [Durusdinium trenchii]|uniref:Solute carrier family 40 member n=1 Tax=Durusdinium trenchii TaxID=1381693 RepID=A0ABP0KNY2_9DINO